MRRDVLGNTTTLSNDRAASAWTDLMEGVLAHSKRAADALQAVIDADPNFAQVHAVKGLVLMTLGRGELVGPARECLAKAEAAALVNMPTEREAGFGEALRHWLAGNPDLAADRLDAIVAANPRDLMAMKFAHAVRFIIGDQTGLMRSVSRVASEISDDTPFAGYVFGCKSFALEENGYYEEAELTGRKAVVLAPQDAWGLHAVAHVLEMTGRADEGYHWLSHDPQFEHCNNFGFHIYWHRALFALELGKVSEVLRLHDTAIRAVQTDDYRDISNGASLLQRLELEGVDVGDRWIELADLAARRVADRRLVFADLHYLLALLGAERAADAEALVANLVADGQTGKAYDSRVARQCGTDLAQGLVDFAAGRYANATERLMRARETRQMMGGSHAQRDVFEQITLEALLRSGDLTRAETILRARLSSRNGHNRFAQSRLERLNAARDQATRLGALLVEAIPAAVHH